MVSKPGRPGLARARPWKQTRPAAAAVRQESSGELLTLVAFDVSCNKARRRVGEICKDYGLKRAQWSVFEGLMTRNRREELTARVGEILTEAEGGGRAMVAPIGKQEVGWLWRISTVGAPVREAGEGTRRRATIEDDITALMGATIEAGEELAKR